MFIFLLKQLARKGLMFILGQVIEGLPLIQTIENLPVGPDDIPEVDVVISDCGQMSALGTAASVNETTTSYHDQCVYNGCNQWNAREIPGSLLAIICFRSAFFCFPLD